MTAAARPRDMWTRFAIDPLADPLARRLAPRRWITPNRVTAVSGALGLAAAGCLAVGLLRLGGTLFLLRFFADCLDGKIARLQGTSSARGAAFDVATDVVCVTSAYAGLAIWAVTHGYVAAGWACATLAAVGCYSWALAFRKQLASEAGLGTGGSSLHRRVDLAGLGWWLAWCRRVNVSPVPWSVEAETLVLGLLPLLGARAAALGIVVALAFYVVATGVNLRRIALVAARMDRDVLPVDEPGVPTR